MDGLQYILDGGSLTGYALLLIAVWALATRRVITRGTYDELKARADRAETVAEDMRGRALKAEALSEALLRREEASR